MKKIAGVDARKLARMNDRERRRLLEGRVYKKFKDLSPTTTDVDDSFFGATPPSIFIGRHGYPKVNAGVLSPVSVRDSEQYDSPGQWYENREPVESVMGYRANLVNSRNTVSITETDTFMDKAKEIAMASTPVDVEVQLKRTPDFDLTFNTGSQPFGPSEKVEKLDITENPSITRAVEKAVGDDDWKAVDAAQYLYNKDLDVYRIQRVLSAGLLGQKDRRKLVPTRWSITATDDTLGKGLRNEVQTNQELGEYQLFANEYNGNYFYILLMPGQWEFELIEVKGAGSVWNPASEAFMKSNYEPYDGRTSYATETAGGYYATRLGVLEYLHRENRQAKAIVFRDVTDEYWAPLGVWVVRETVRNAFDEKQTSSEIKPLLDHIFTKMSVSETQLREESTMLDGVQKNINTFF